MSFEEELQQRIEQGKEEAGLDAKAYYTVFSTLRKRQPSSLPATFADNVVRVLEQRKASASRASEYWLIFGGGFSLVVAFVVAVAMSGFEPNAGFLTGIADYSGLFVFGIGFVLFLSYMERHLLRKNRAV